MTRIGLDRSILNRKVSIMYVEKNKEKIGHSKENIEGNEAFLVGNLRN